MPHKLNILTILFLLLWSARGWAASCPTDSVITFDQNGVPTEKILYTYDDAGRQTCYETWRQNDQGQLVGQSKTTTEFYADGKTKSTSSWQWSDKTNDWKGVARTYYEYNSKGNTTLYAIYGWSDATNDWTNQTKTEYEYTTDFKQKTTITYSGSGDTWIFKTKQEYDYDTKGHTILNRYWSGYDTSTQQWVGSSWKVWAYTSTIYPSGISLYEEYTWENGAWAGKTKYDNEYNASGKIILKRNYANYNPATQSWDYNSEYHYAYDQWNNTTLTEIYTWNVDYWMGYSKEEKTYNAEGDILLQALYAWDDEARKWIGVTKYNKVEDERGNLILDEDYTWQGNDWVGNKKEAYTYTNDNLRNSTLVYRWDVVKEDWVFGTRDTAAFDAHKNQTLDERYTWAADATLAEGGYWKGTKKDSTTYNDKNVETASFTFQWDDTNRRWLGKSKYRKEFDNANNLVLEEEYTWQLDMTLAEGGLWKGIKKEEYAYNAAKQQTLAIIYAWSDAIEDWIGSTKKISDYDDKKNQTLNEQYTWAVEATATGGYWKGTEKAEYTFNNNKQQTSSIVYAWDDVARDWVYASKTLSDYDSYKNQILDERYTYDIPTSAWVGTLKKEYGYNAQGQQVMFAYYSWDATNSMWIGTQKEENEVDEQGRTLMHATYTWDASKETWKGKSRDTYMYLEGTVQSQHATYVWKDGAWVGDKLTDWLYTQSGKVSVAQVYTWNAATETWKESTRRENTYTDEVLTSYYTFTWENEDWAPVSAWLRVNADKEQSFERWNGGWSITQEKSKTYDEQGRLQQETMQNWSQGVQTAGSKTEYTYTGDNLTQKASYVYDSGTATWVGVEKTTNTYNDANQLTNTTQYTYADNTWRYVSKTDNAYDGQTTTTTNYISMDGTTWQGIDKQVKEYGEGKDVTITAYEWRNNGWQGVSKTGYTYYANGKEKSVTAYMWQSNTWVPDTKTEYEYSGSKNIVTATYAWEANTWVGQSKVGYYYNEGEDLTTATWEWSNGAWVGKTKLGESYNDLGYMTGQTTYTWNGSAFMYKSKTENEYGATQRDKTTATYNWNGTKWVGQNKSGVTYASNGKIASETKYKWDNTADAWVYTTKTENEYGTNAKDLTKATYTWDSAANAWVGVSKSGETYASNGKIASETSYAWGEGDWINLKKTEYEYGSGKNNSVAQYVWGTDDWVGVSKQSETFTTQGDPWTKYTYCWRDGAWADSLKQEHSYDERGNDTLFIDAQWKDGVWANLATSTKWEMRYDAKDSLILDAHYTWNTSKKDWKGKGNRYLYEYDANGNQIFYERDTWSSNQWTGSSKQEYTYDANSRLLASYYWSYDKTKKRWKGVSKSEYAYLPDGTNTMTATYRWNNDRFDWEGTSKTETLWDDNGNQLGSCQYTWSSSLWRWIGMFKYENVYDSKNNLVQQTTSRYNTDWYYDTRTTYVYHDKYGQVGTSTETWVNGQWYMSSETSKQYDDDADSKMRVDLTASYSTNGVQTVRSEKTYYYSCDPKYTLTVEAKDDLGTVTGSGTYTYYAHVPVHAEGDSVCTTFSRWTSTSPITTFPTTSSTAERGLEEASITVVVTSDMTLTAEFTPTDHTLTAGTTDLLHGAVKIEVE